MNRAQFMNTIDRKDPISIDTIVNFFDHTMVMYDIIGELNDVSVSSQIISPVGVAFNLKFSNVNQANIVYSKVTGDLQNKISIYGKMFNIQTSYMDKDDLSMKLNQM